MTSPAARLLMCLLAGLGWLNQAPLVRAQSGRPIVEFDAAKDWNDFPKYFKPFFTDPKRTVLITEEGVQMKFFQGAPSGFAGLESDANLAGNFDIEIQYDFSQFPEKADTGYGVSFGVWVKADPEIGDAALTRIVTPWAGQQVRLTRAVPQGTKTAYGITGIPSKTLKGKMMMRRVGSEIIALSAETPDGELLEWARFPFTDKPVRLVRLTGDTGGASAEMVGKISGLRIRAGAAVPAEPGKPGPKAHVAQPMPETSAVRKPPSPIPTLDSSPEVVTDEKAKTPVLGALWVPVLVGLVGLGVGIAIGRRWPAVSA